MRIDGQRFFTRINMNEMGSLSTAHMPLKRVDVLKAAIGIEPMNKGFAGIEQVIVTFD